MKYFILCIAICTLLPCCKKNSVTVSKKDLITKAVWVYESGGIDTDKNGTIDLTFEFLGTPPACLLDNRGTFNSDGSGVNDEGPMRCLGGGPQTTSFNWALQTNDTELSITGNGLGGISGIFKIKELTETRLGLAKDSTVQGFAASIILNLKH